MKILMTCTAAGGMWTYAVDLLRELGALGCELDLAVLAGELDEARRIEASRLTNVVVHEAPRAAGEGRRREWLAALVADRGPDLLHVNDFASGARPWTVPVVLVAHDAAPGGRAEPVVEAVDRADHVIATSAAGLRELLAQYPEADAEGREAVIRHGIDPRRWPVGQRREPFVLAAGDLDDRDAQLHSLLRTARAIEHRVVIAGAGKRARNPSADGQPPNVLLPGPLTRERFAAYCRRAAVYTHPGRSAPFGLAVLEAALSGCALVLADIAPLRELWDGAARFVEPGDESALAESLATLLGDTEEAARLAVAARARALRYGARRMALAYIAVYANVLDQRSAANTLLTQGAA